MTLSWTSARRLLIFTGGMAVVLAGIAMLVLPGPGIAGIVLGLAILATEFVWAQRLLKKMKESGKNALPMFFKKDPDQQATRSQATEATEATEATKATRPADSSEGCGPGQRQSPKV